MKSVLVIDSNNSTREALVNVISSTFPEATVIAAPDGSKGLHMAYNKRPDVIILEGELIGLDSFRTAKVLRHLPETRQIPLIALTCDDLSEDDSDTSLKATCHALMIKPVSSDKLIQTINSLQGEGGYSQFVSTDVRRLG